LYCVVYLDLDDISYITVSEKDGPVGLRLNPDVPLNRVAAVALVHLMARFLKISTASLVAL
jgi:hypothetical protein